MSGFFLKSRVTEIYVKRIRVSQGEVQLQSTVDVYIIGIEGLDDSTKLNT